jgi:hypothetical protein
MNGQRILGLGTPTNSSDAVTKAYADALVTGVSSTEIKNGTNTSSKMTAALSEILNGSTPLNMNAQKIINIGTATAGTDALNRDTGDSRYYLSSTALNALTAPSASLSLNS